jgi:DNA mismatch repair protein MutS2
MQLIPNDVYTKLEFDKVLELLEKQCLGALGVEEIERLVVHQDANIIDKLLTEVFEYVTSIDERHSFPIRNYDSIQEDLKMLAIEGYVLSVEGLQRINNIMLQIRDIFNFFKSKKANYPSLYDIIKDTRFDEDLIKSIQRVIDEKGEIRPDASEELMNIRKRTVSKKRDLDKEFSVVIKEYAAKGWLKDTIESFRNGRRVLAVPSEHKRKIRGLIHDESATGRTAFIEPESIIEINNDIFDLEQDERREIYRILRALSNELRPYTNTFAVYENIIVRFDVIQAKASLAIQMNATKPIIQPYPHIGWKKAYHPLLLLKNKNDGKPTIPLNLTFLHDNRILVLSGPNAGGKSIAMKAIGLLQLMTQAGLLVPVDKESQIGVFTKIFADIGDQQSIEDDLSTYSSRLLYARLFIENADVSTLVLIDEFGSGTDPKIGGAIAEAILNDLHHKKVFGVITTHYSNLKIFAYKNKGILNGSMNYNKETLSPTYEMQVGRPGSSYAFEIAEKTGLPNRILKYAKHRAGKNEKAVDELLVDLQREKQELDEQLLNMQKREQQLEKLIGTYEQMSKDYEYKRKKLKLDIKESEIQQTAKINKDLEKLVRELKEEKNLEKAKALSQQVREERKETVKAITELREEVYYKPTEKKAVKAGEIKVGDFVKLRTGGATGQIESMDKGDAYIHIGQMKMKVKLRDLQHANAPLEVNTELRIQTSTIEKNAKFEPKIDIRGMSKEEAMQIVQEFMDEAITSSANRLEIIHGKGNGILRNMARQKIREYSDVVKVYHEVPNRGGDGITIVEL